MTVFPARVQLSNIEKKISKTNHRNCLRFVSKMSDIEPPPSSKKLLFSVTYVPFGRGMASNFTKF